MSFRPIAIEGLVYDNRNADQVVSDPWWAKLHGVHLTAGHIAQRFADTIAERAEDFLLGYTNYADDYPENT